MKLNYSGQLNEHHYSYVKLAFPYSTQRIQTDYWRKSDYVNMDLFKKNHSMHQAFRDKHTLKCLWSKYRTDVRHQGILRYTTPCWIIAVNGHNEDQTTLSESGKGIFDNRTAEGVLCPIHWLKSCWGPQESASCAWDRNDTCNTVGYLVMTFDFKTPNISRMHLYLNMWSFNR